VTDAQPQPIGSVPHVHVVREEGALRGECRACGSQEIIETAAQAERRGVSLTWFKDAKAFTGKHQRCGTREESA